MDIDALFMKLQTKEIVEASNQGTKENPEILVECSDGEKVHLYSDFLQKYKVCLSVVKGKAEKWYIKER